MEDDASLRDVAFVVVSCDKYADLWDPFFHSLRKYWPDCPCPVYLVTNFKDCGRPGVTTLKVGEDRSYADNLRVAISQVREPWVILWLEDVFFSKPVDTSRLAAVVAEARSIPVGYLSLSPQLPMSYDSGEIGPLPKGIRYRSAIGIALYRKETLQKLLVPGASAWDLDTSAMSDGMEEQFYSVTSRSLKKPILPWTHGVIKGRWCWPAISFLRREGFAHLIPGRTRLDLRSIAHLAAFKLHNGLYRLLKKHWI